MVLRNQSKWAMALVLIGIAAVLTALFVGVKGLFDNPIKAVDASGLTTIEGSFEPYPCSNCVQGYVQAGARSVFVVFPKACKAPNREQQISVAARKANDLGKGSYRATNCAQLQ